MVSDGPKTKIQGKKFAIVHCEGALESFNEALKSVPANRHAAFARALIQQIGRLADGHEPTKENFPAEGNVIGPDGQKHRFHAFKRKPLRGYCWRSIKHPNTYYISHYIYKNFQKLKKKDTDIVDGNFKRIEVDGHER